MILNLQFFVPFSLLPRQFFPINLSIIPTKSTETFSFLWHSKYVELPQGSLTDNP